MADTRTTVQDVYSFEEGFGLGPQILGGKGASLARMTGLGLPVPPGFTVSCSVAQRYLEDGAVPTETIETIHAHLDALEARMERRLGDPKKPLLVSIRSGAPVSMPGMMDTLLNVGLNEATLSALAEESDNWAFAWSCYRRFVDSYARIVRRIDEGAIEDAIFDLDEESDEAVTRTLLALIAERGAPVPDNPRDQIIESVEAVFQSWLNPRAVSYRNFRGIDHAIGTAATVQAMVFGNLGRESASGVAFSRDPSSGRVLPFGDILFDAQGEDVVSGEHDADSLDLLEEVLPDVSAQLKDSLETIERDIGDLCEVEFTIQEGKLWILQSRVGLRSGRAAVKVVVDLVDAGLLTVDAAVQKVTPAQLEAAASPHLAGSDGHSVLGKGLAASPGAVNGYAVFDSQSAIEMASAGKEAVLMRPTTSPSDVAGFIASSAVVTGRGGRTSHAAVVARGMYRPAVCGIGDMKISTTGDHALINGQSVRHGDEVTVDGDSGLLLRGHEPLEASLSTSELSIFLDWVNSATSGEKESGHSAQSTDGAVIRLESQEGISSSDLKNILSEHVNPTQITLLVSEAWLRGCDTFFNIKVGAVKPLEGEPLSLNLFKLQMEVAK